MQIDELPPGRPEITTHVVFDTEAGRRKAYESVREELAGGGRAFIVFPLIDESVARVRQSQSLLLQETQSVRLWTVGLIEEEPPKCSVKDCQSTATRYIV